MIKAKATINGTVCKAVSLRQDKDDRQMAQFSIRLTVPGSREDMSGKEVFVSVSYPAEGFDTNQVVPVTRIEASGTLTFKKSGDNIYLNFLADSIDFNPSREQDIIEGTLEFKGTVGKNIEVKTDRKDRPYVSFSAFSSEKVKDTFEFIWVRFIRFDYTKELFLQPKAKIQATGKLSITAYQGRLSLDCQADSIKVWERQPFPPTSNQQPPF